MSTIRVSAAGKRALEALRQRWEAVEGRKLTQEEAAGRAFALLANNPELIHGQWKPTKEQLRFMEQFIGAVDAGATDASEIDEVLYGHDPP